MRSCRCIGRYQAAIEARLPINLVTVVAAQNMPMVEPVTGDIVTLGMGQTIKIQHRRGRPAGAL